MRRVLPLVIALAGCDLYFEDARDDEPPICALVDYAYPQVLDPYSGACVVDTTGQCRPCEPCPAQSPALDWAACPGPCDGLAERACLDTPSCRAAYTDGDEFAACWSVAPSGPVPGSCAGLDAYECSRHDNCAAHYDDLGGASARFRACTAEPAGLCDAVTCESGSHCEEQCYPCDSPDGTPCPPVCQGSCVPD